MTAKIVEPRSNLCDIKVSGTYDETATTVYLEPLDIRLAAIPTVPFYFVWWNATDYGGSPTRDPLAEYIRVTAVASNALTVTRGQLGTAPSVKNLAGKEYRVARVWQDEDIDVIEARFWQLGVSVKDHGATGDGVTDDLAAFQAAIAADTHIVVPRGTYVLSDDLTITSGITLQLLQGAKLSPASGKVLTIQGPLVCDNSQHFTGSGTIALAANTKLAYVVPQWWGVTGDGSTDDYLAINKCIAASEGIVVQFPQGTYRVTEPIDCTINTHEGIRLEGTSQGDEGTIFKGDTEGEPVFDCTANQRCSFRNFKIIPGTTGCDIGMMFIRNTALDQSSYNALRDVTIYLNNDETANGGVGTVAVYNVCSEIFTVDNCTLRGDWGIWCDRTNTLSVASDYETCQTSGQNSSMSVIRVTGGYLIGMAGAAFRGDTGADVILHCGMSRHSASTPYQYAMRLTGWNGLKHFGTVDTYTSILNLTSASKSIILETYFAVNGSYPIIEGTAAGAGLIHANIMILPTSGSEATSTDLFYVDSATGAGHLWNCIIHSRGAATSIDCANAGSILKSCSILSDKTLADWSITNSVALRYNVELRCTDGTKIWGSVSTGTRQVIDGWYQDVIPGTQAATAMSRFDGDDGEVWVAPRAGSVTGVMLYLDDDRTAGSVTATVYKNGGTIGLTTVVDDDPVAFNTTFQAKDADTFAAGDLLQVYLTTASYTPADSVNARAAIEVEM